MLKDGEGSRWVLGEWRSAPFDELETRPWSPLLIGGAIAFCARRNGRRYVGWGERIYGPYDDAYDLDDYENQPIFLARVSSNYFVVRPDVESERFPFQITYLARGFGITILKLRSFGPHEVLPEPGWTPSCGQLPSL